jgi:hypothetical protein
MTKKLTNNHFSLLLIFFTVICFSVSAEDPTFQWGVHYGGSGDEEANDIAVDQFGSVITVGSFSGTVDFDPGSAVHNLTAVGKKSAFVQKLDSLGQLVWAHAFGGTAPGSEFNAGNNVQIGEGGSVYFSGCFSGKSDFDPGSSVFELESFGSRDDFILKLDKDGLFVWAKSFGNTEYTWGNASALDNYGHLYTAGYFKGAMDIPTINGVVTLTSAGSYDILLAKLDTLGQVLWAKRFGAGASDQAKDITTDKDGNILVTGSFSSASDLDDDPLTFELLGKGGPDPFVLKLDSTGKYLWSTSMGDDFNDQGRGICTDTNGNIYSSGTVFGDVDFDPGPGVFEIKGIGQYDFYIQKLDPQGKFLWAKTIGNTVNDYFGDISVDQSGNVYTTGKFIGHGYFDGARGKTFRIRAKNYWDNFILKLDTDGNFGWVNQVSSSSSSSAGAITVDYKGNLYTTNGFITYADIDPTTTIQEEVSNGGLDLYTLKLSQQCLTNLSLIDVTNITDDKSITANNTSGTYRWLDCKINYEPISGETNKTFNPLVNGSYALEVSEQGCLNTSVCVDINGVVAESVFENGYSNTIELYPNPTRGAFALKFDNVQEEVIINIHTVDGHLLASAVYRDSQLVNCDIDANLPGIYFVEIIKSDGSVAMLKLVKN